MRKRSGRLVTTVWAAFLTLAAHIYPQTHEETLSGPDAHEKPLAERGYLFGNWGGVRSALLERGVSFDLQYISDNLANVVSDRDDRFVAWNRFRGTVDVDFGPLINAPDWYFHATAVWQAGGHLNTYLGLLTSPSGMSSSHTFRLDSWWIEKRSFEERLAIRAGQFAGQDFYGAQHYAASFIFEPMGYALGNLFTDFESFDPPSTPAAEIRLVPFQNFYVKSMVIAEDRHPFDHNPTGLVPQFNGGVVSVYEIGFTPSKPATSIRAFDNVDSRKGYSGLYQFGASYNPGKFKTASGRSDSGNFLLYWMASQALWRVDPSEAKGLDATFAYDWSPPDLNRNNRVLTIGLRFNEPLPLPLHNTMALGYVQNHLSPDFRPNKRPGTPNTALNSTFSWMSRPWCCSNRLSSTTRMRAAAPTMRSCSDSEPKWSFDVPNHPLTEAPS
jgi:porin